MKTKKRKKTNIETNQDMNQKNYQDKHEDKEMTVADHLREMRNRILICIVFLILSFLVGMYFAPQLVTLLLDIGKTYNYEYVYIAPQELLLQYFSIALVAGVVVTFPVILYQIWAFIKPGLKKGENTIFMFSMIFGLICFGVGILFAFRIMLPFMLHFLINLSKGSGVTASISVQNYISFLMTIFMIFGIIFEFPMVSILLTQMGLLRVSWMKKGRRVIIVLIFFVAALITPPDIVSQIMVAIPMIALYEFSIILCVFAQKFRKHSED